MHVEYWFGDPDFNPRSREGSDNIFMILIPSKYISIHAPARGSDVVVFNGVVLCRISIHAPARGAPPLN